MNPRRGRGLCDDPDCRDARTVLQAERMALMDTLHRMYLAFSAWRWPDTRLMEEAHILLTY